MLTSGQEASVIEGLDVVRELVRRAGNRIIIMPGGNITARNLKTVLAVTGARELHVTANANVESAMQFRNPRVFMGGTFRPPEYSRSITDSAGVRQLLRAAQSK